jgi:hypothetical protein
MVSLSPWQLKALVWLSRPDSGHTCTIVGAMLTQRHSSFGHQTSAREGGRTLRALERRGLVSYRDIDDGLTRRWDLTPKGVAVLASETKG